MVVVREDKSEKYPPRTYFNAKSGDVTLALAVDLTTAGEKLTHKAAGEKYIGFQITKDTDPIEIARALYKFMKKRNAKTLNIAGNGIYTFAKHGWTQDEVNNFVCNVVGKVHQFWPIEKIFTGGQTGTDLAGAVIAEHLKIEALITLPKGYLQRFENNVDVVQNQEDIYNQINHWTPILEKDQLNVKLQTELPVNAETGKKSKI